MFVLLAAAWNDCSAGDEGSRFGFATLYSAVTALLTGAAFLITATMLRRRPGPTRLLASAVVAAFVGYVLFGALLPASFSLFDTHRGTCPGNVPPWWPSWLPI